MSFPTPRIRVAAYVIRKSDTGAQLLVFDHADYPGAGTQVPAGGVAAGESLPEAVRREVAEETGLTDVTVVAEVGREDKPHPDTGRPQRTTYFHLLVPAGGPDSWMHHVSGEGEDAALRFACRFTPLPLPQQLAGNQDVFLGQIDY